jgi:hypothetical protein
LDRKSFGRLVATLRKENRNEFDEILTQQNLGVLAHIPAITIQKIEQGRQTNLKPSMLLSLAHALQLNSLETRDFILASLGIRENKSVHPQAKPEPVLFDLKNKLSHLQTPAYIVDNFGDVIALNPAGNAIFNMDVAKMQAPDFLSQYNLVRLLFSYDLKEVQQVVNDAYVELAHQVVRLFKIWSLKVRNHWYFLRLLPELNHFPAFREQWQSPAFHNEDVNSFLHYLTINNPELGMLRFSASNSVVMTSAGDLFLVSLLPQDPHTAEICLQLSRELGTEAISLATWPKPEEPPERREKGTRRRGEKQ